MGRALQAYSLIQYINEWSISVFYSQKRLDGLRLGAFVTAFITMPQGIIFLLFSLLDLLYSLERVVRNQQLRQRQRIALQRFARSTHNLTHIFVAFNATKLT